MEHKCSILQECTKHRPHILLNLGEVTREDIKYLTDGVDIKVKIGRCLRDSLNQLVMKCLTCPIVVVVTDESPDEDHRVLCESVEEQ